MQIRKPAALAAALLSGGAIAQAANDPAQLLRNAATAASKYSYVGQIQSVGFGSNHANAVLFRIEHRAPDLTRRWYLAPQSLYGDSIITHGDKVDEIDMNNHRIVQTDNNALDDQVALDDNLGLLFHNYRPVMGPNDNVAGRSALQVFLVNKYSGETVLRVWVDSQTNLVLQKQQYASNGAVTNEMRFEQIHYTGSIPMQIFAVPSAGFKVAHGSGHGLPSSDVQAVVRTAGFAAKGPKYLPDGFVPVGGDVSDIKGVRSVHLMYSDGLRIISLFENSRGAAVDLHNYLSHNSKIRAHEAQYVEDGPTRLIAWSDGKLHYALVSEMGINELTRIASSVTP